MRWFDRSNKTYRISTLETAIARLASEVVQLKAIAEQTQSGVQDIQATLAGNHVEHTRCEGVQDGRWKEHLAEHKAILESLTKLTRLAERNAEDIRILSASITRIADRQRDKGD